MTRVAAGHPGIWPDICAENAGAIVGALDALVEDLQAMRARVADARPGGAARRAAVGQRWRRRNLPARVVRPDNLTELRIPVPDRAGVLAEITSLAADAGIGIYDIEIAHSAEGPRGVLILVVESGDAASLGRRGGGARLPLPGRAARMTAPAHSGRRRRGALPRHRAHARREVHFAPGRAPGRPGRGDLRHPWPVGRRRRRRLAGRGRGHGRAGRARPERDGAAARRPRPPPRAGRAARLWEFRHLHAAAVRPGGRVPVGDRAGG